MVVTDSGAARRFKLLAQEATPERNQITVDEVVSELKRHAVGAKRDMVTMRGLQLLGQHLSMFKDKVEHGADFSLLDWPSSATASFGWHLWARSQSTRRIFVN